MNPTPCYAEDNNSRTVSSSDRVAARSEARTRGAVTGQRMSLVIGEAPSARLSNEYGNYSRVRITSGDTGRSQGIGRSTGSQAVLRFF